MCVESHCAFSYFAESYYCELVRYWDDDICGFSDQLLQVESNIRSLLQDNEVGKHLCSHLVNLNFLFNF